MHAHPTFTCPAWLRVLALAAAMSSAAHANTEPAPDAVIAPAAKGNSVAFQGTMGNKAVLVVNGRPPRAVAPGESLGNVKLVSVRGEQAVVLVDGETKTLHLGEAQANVVGEARRATGSQISMAVDANGHFMAEGAINGRPTRFMVDTGATTIAMSLADAVKLGVDYRKGQPIQVGTANGVAHGYSLKLHSVRIGDVEVYDVDAVITSQRMPFVLLGNSFLGRFQMRRDADIMVLTRR